jgi:hypothetical protein
MFLFKFGHRESLSKARGQKPEMCKRLGIHSQPMGLSAASGAWSGAITRPWSRPTFSVQRIPEHSIRTILFNQPILRLDDDRMV